MLLSNIKIYDDLPDEKVLEIACQKNKINIKEVNTWQVVKKSIDARDKNNVHYIYSFKINEPIDVYKDEDFFVQNKTVFDEPPVIVGAGPAGLFATYLLAINGYNPILLEQGKSIDERIMDVENFINNRILNERSNVQFGEGGAGAFSDGKLTTNVNSELNLLVLKTFVKFGAPNEIMYLSKPHVGTDILRSVIKNMRLYMQRKGAIVRFNSKVTDFVITNNHINGVVLENGEIISSEHVILATGHSARDIFNCLYKKNVKLEPKPFSMRI
jgi:uncharacterized FAD-dependent dehydrogenase